jgi:hypothetical protein
MPKPLDLGRCDWLNTVPKPNRDIRSLYSDFPTERDCEHERKIRIAILERGRSIKNAELARLLRDAEKYQPASVGCCPVLAWRFQIWFVDAALELHTRLKRKGVPYTLFDLDEAVDVGDLGSIDWRRLNATLRKRITRILGKHVVVIGMGEVEYDAFRNMWQPHYHVMIYGAKWGTLKTLRAKHYSAERTGPRPMVRSAEGEPATWFSYMSKLVAFAKAVQQSGQTCRVRLNGPLSREYFRYLAGNRPTSFVFGVNCSLVKRELVLDEDEDDLMVKVRSRYPHPVRPLFGQGND